MLRCIRAENRKLRRSAIWLVFLILPLLSAIYGTFNFIQNLGILKREWYYLWTQHTLFYATFFFAPLIAVYAAYLWRLEHLGHNWNLIMTAPVPPFQLYFAKFVVVAKMTLLTQGWVFALFLICGKLWAHIPGWPPVAILLWMLRGFVGGLVIAALQLLLSMVIHSFSVPVLIALGGGIGGMLFVSKGMGLCWPYALMILGMNANKTEDMVAGGMLPFFASCCMFSAVFFGAANRILTKNDVRT